MGLYFLKRIFLIIPVIIGITFVSYGIIQFVPGGPLESQIYRDKSGNLDKENISSQNISTNISEKSLNELKSYYGFDKPFLVRYTNWILNISKGDFGNSFFYSEPVLKVIGSRIPITLFLGFTGLFLTYLFCIPLGILKAIKNGSKFDTYTSFLVLFGYTIPGWAFGALALILFGGGTFLNIFPLGGIVSDNFQSLNFFGKVFDLIQHIFLPLLSYMIAGFASLTILTKNSIIDNISSEYMKFAYSKGLSEKRIISKYLLRNSLIPLITGFGQNLTMIVSGSILIEKIFNIQGMGLLAFNSILNRDYMVSMGILVISSMIMLLGNIMSDILYVRADPRIKFK